MERQTLVGMIWAYTTSQLVCIAAKLNIASSLESGPILVSEYASLAGLGVETFRRLARGFEACGLIRHCEDDDKIELTEMGRWLRPDIEGSLYYLALRTCDLYYPAWSALLRSLNTDQAGFEVAFGMPYFEYLASDQEHVRTFNAMISKRSTAEVQSIVAAYDFSLAKHIVDLGGGQGILLSEILKINVSAKGTLFECPSVIEETKAAVIAAGVAERCSLIGGDFRLSVPLSGDIYILKHVLHNWSNDWCVRILNNCRAAISQSGRLLVIERIIEDKWTVQMIRSDLHMLVMMNGAERTEAEVKALFEQSGFELSRRIPISDGHILEAVPVSRSRDLGKG